MAPTIGELVRVIGAGGPGMIRSAARLMTRLENEPQRLPELFRAVADVKGCREDPLGCLLPRVVLGITGAPGSGKSTLTDALVREYRRRHPGRRIGVIAVDPSSPFTGGAVLGDRVRMMRHATDPMVFVRSMATRGHLGGLTLGVRAVIRVMALIGCDVVMLETVGVGQSEVEVAGVADLVLIVMAPGLGDSIQLLKAGLMEIGDLFIINKADRPDAAQLHSYVLAMLKLGAAEAADLEHHADSRDTIGSADAVDDPIGFADRPAPDRVEPRAFLVSAATNDGVPVLVDDLEALTLEHFDRWSVTRARIVQQEVRDAVLEDARSRLDLALGPAAAFSDRVDAVLRGEVSVEELARDLLTRTSRDQV